MKLDKIKLNQISKIELEKREMTSLVGGSCCNCGCAGPSSIDDNHQSNYINGFSITSTGPGGVKKCTWDGSCPDVGVG
ncbi:hypothetical protein FACS189432_01660 [Bacteroidia bacterium]|nr:hypothetical protein FACS189426_01420 [Bacteroidia bacterium]GHT26703.1 hypothetical protein FACS189432_01660 [Bacteroidia bacterium]